MAKANKKDYNCRENEASASLNQALLDEFFSIIASIATRLTKVNTCDKNGNEPDKGEAIKP